MKGSVMHVLRIGVLVLLGALLTGCGYNRLQQQDEQVTAAWSEVLNQYQRRADLVPNLVNTVKGAVQPKRTFSTAWSKRAPARPPSRRRRS